MFDRSAPSRRPFFRIPHCARLPINYVKPSLEKVQFELAAIGALILLAERERPVAGSIHKITINGKEIEFVMRDPVIFIQTLEYQVQRYATGEAGAKLKEDSSDYLRSKLRHLREEVYSEFFRP